MSKGYVYIITNKGKPGICKIGFTRKLPEERAKELDGTHDPYPHEVAYSIEIDNAKEVKKKIHDELKEYRINDTISRQKHTGKEWFRCSIEQCKLVLKKYESSPSYSKNTSLNIKKEGYIYVTGDEFRSKISYSPKCITRASYVSYHENAREVVYKACDELKNLKKWQYFQ